MYTVMLKDTDKAPMSFNIKGFNSKKRYSFVKGVPQKVLPVDYEAMKAYSDKLDFPDEKDLAQKRRMIPKFPPIDHRATKELRGGGESVPTATTHARIIQQNQEVESINRKAKREADGSILPLSRQKVRDLV